MDYLTVRELMALLKVSRATLYRLLEAGLPSIGTGRLRRFEREAVLRWFAGRGRGEASAVLPDGKYRCDGCGGWWLAPRQTRCTCGGERRLIGRLGTG